MPYASRTKRLQYLRSYQKKNRAKIAKQRNRYNIKHRQENVERCRSNYRKRAPRFIKLSRLYRQQHPRKRAEWVARYNKKYRKYERERRRRWRRENRDHYTAYARNYRKRNNKKLSEYRELRYRKNRDKILAKSHVWRIKKLQNGGSFTGAEWAALRRRYGYRCLRCGKKKKLTADHVIPIFDGGRNDIENIQPLCGPCNSSKGIKCTDYRSAT